MGISYFSNQANFPGRYLSEDGNQTRVRGKSQKDILGLGQPVPKRGQWEAMEKGKKSADRRGRVVEVQILHLMETLNLQSPFPPSAADPSANSKAFGMAVTELQLPTCAAGSCWYSIDFFHVTATNQNLLSFQVLYPSSAINQFCARAAQKVWVSPCCSHSATLGAKWRLLGWPGACWLEQWKQPVAMQSPVWANKIPDS